MDVVESIYPTVAELCKINNNQTCPECSAVFHSESNLNLHLVKTHKKEQLLPTHSKNRIYYCPVASCIYNKSSHFKKMKYLKQHYLKVHSEGIYTCSSCKKNFSTESARNRHSEYCNVVFKCCDCDMSYACYETLKTHGRRKKHKILDKIAYKTPTENSVLKTTKSEQTLSFNKMRLLLPKPSTSFEMIIVTDTSEQSCQTETSPQNNQETQTLLQTRMPQYTVETQTIGDYYSKTVGNSLKSVKTQTKTKEAKTASSNTSFNLEDLELNVMNELQRNSSTQTNAYDQPEHMYSSTSTHDSIHTDTSDLLIDTLDSNFFNCNMETQTDFIFNDELFKYCDDYTNMCTQTCEDLLGEIGLNNTHTQTVFDDVLKSVESQTIVSHSQNVQSGCKDNVTHMETQTDTHFKQMLEEINA